MTHRNILLKSALICSFAMFVMTLTAQKDVSKEITAANMNFKKLFKAGDVDAFLTVYTDDARVLPPNGPAVMGKEGLREFWSGMMAAGITPMFNTISALAYGKVAIEEGTASILADGQEVDNVKYIVIWHKVGKEWKMHQDIWNSNNPVE